MANSLRFTYPVSILHRTGWKAIPGKVAIVPIEEQFDFTVRCITRLEFQCWKSMEDELALEDKILQEVVLSHPDTFHGMPWNWDYVYAGIVEQLKAHILKISGFLGEPHPMLIERVDSYLRGQDAKFDLMIMSVFHQYTLEDLMDMDNEMWHRVGGLAQASLALQGIDPDAILDPEKFQKRQKAESVRNPNAPNVVRGAPNGGSIDRSIVHESPPLQFISGK